VEKQDFISTFKRRPQIQFKFDIDRMIWQLLWYLPINISAIITFSFFFTPACLIYYITEFLFRVQVPEVESKKRKKQFTISHHG
jgi:hypothetical protein